MSHPSPKGATKLNADIMTLANCLFLNIHRGMKIPSAEQKILLNLLLKILVITSEAVL